MQNPQFNPTQPNRYDLKRRNDCFDVRLSAESRACRIPYLCAGKLHARVETAVLQPDDMETAAGHRKMRLKSRGRRFLLHFIHHFPAKLPYRRRLCVGAAGGRSVLETSMLGAFGLRAGRRAAFALILLGAVALSAPARSETLTVGVDQASILKIPGEVSTLVIGNPLIADASLQRGGVLVVTGKSFGSTNLMALDRTGSVVMERTIRVHAPADKNLVVVFRGVERESYSCAPNCERRIMLGDSVPFFSAALAQAGARTSAASPTPGH